MSLTAIAETQTYDVLLEEQPDGTHQASILGWTDCRAIATTAEEAIEKVRTLLNERIAKSKIIQIKVKSSHPIPHYHPRMIVRHVLKTIRSWTKSIKRSPPIASP